MMMVVMMMMVMWKWPTWTNEQIEWLDWNKNFSHGQLNELKLPGERKTMDGDVDDDDDDGHGYYDDDDCHDNFDDHEDYIDDEIFL